VENAELGGLFEAELGRGAPMASAGWLQPVRVRMSRTFTLAINF